MIFPRISEGRTGTREVAVAGLLFWAFLTGSLWFFKATTDIQYYKEIYISITGTVWLFATAAFLGKMGANLLEKHQERNAHLPPK